MLIGALHFLANNNLERLCKTFALTKEKYARVKLVRDSEAASTAIIRRIQGRRDDLVQQDCQRFLANYYSYRLIKPENKPAFNHCLAHIYARLVRSRSGRLETFWKEDLKEALDTDRPKSKLRQLEDDNIRLQRESS